jgi:ribosomal protein S15P/S13E
LRNYLKEVSCNKEKPNHNVLRNHFKKFNKDHVNKYSIIKPGKTTQKI